MTIHVYTASKPFRKKMWLALSETLPPDVVFTSSWIKEGFILDESDPVQCRRGWIKNIADVMSSDFLICYAEKDDELSGTLVEIGVALGCGTPVVLVGNCDRFATWQHHPIVGRAANIEEGLSLGVALAVGGRR